MQTFQLLVLHQRNKSHRHQEGHTLPKLLGVEIRQNLFEEVMQLQMISLLRFWLELHSSSHYLDKQLSHREHKVQLGLLESNVPAHSHQQLHPFVFLNAFDLYALFQFA